jgi:hypothetical protein
LIEGSKGNGSGVYVLETGDCGAARLQMQDEIYGASTRQMMLDAGLKPGMLVLDLACGTGMIRAELATEDEIATLVAELKRLACDDSVLLAQARMPAAALAVK